MLARAVTPSQLARQPMTQNFFAPEGDLAAFHVLQDSFKDMEARSGAMASVPTCSVTPQYQRCRTPTSKLARLDCLGRKMSPSPVREVRFDATDEI